MSEIDRLLAIAAEVGDLRRIVHDGTLDNATLIAIERVSEREGCALVADRAAQTYARFLDDERAHANRQGVLREQARAQTAIDIGHAIRNQQPWLPRPHPDVLARENERLRVALQAIIDIKADGAVPVAPKGIEMAAVARKALDGVFPL